MSGDGLTLFLAGDVMLGRGIDQVQEASVDPSLHERHVRDARDYVALAEDANGPIPAPVGPEWVWGDALEAIERSGASARIVNLETAVTTSDAWWRGKGIHYRMHPGNVRILERAGIDVCVLANNHILDWGREGLVETLRTLDEATVGRCGAGGTRAEATAPAIVRNDGPRVVVYALALPDAGVPADWAATGERAGVSWLPAADASEAHRLADLVAAERREGDVVVVSAHWGGNWGYDVPDEHRDLARRWIDAGAADVVFGHSSHHPKGVEVYRGAPVVYGAGDFINDYEGIRGHASFRPDLAVAWFATFPAGGGVRLDLEVFERRRFRLERASADDVAWLGDTLDRESRRWGAAVERSDERRLTVRSA